MTANPTLEAFRGEVRDWIEANCPIEMRKPFRSADDWYWGGKRAAFPDENARVWFERMREKRWIVPDWPVSYGGAGLDPEFAAIVRDELRQMKCRRPLVSLGVTMLGPVLFEFGTEAQRREHLPSIATGKIRWCQGYSEPGAGSDLASLRCKAVRRGDKYVISGQKIWTSGAHHSDWIFCLVRTGEVAERQNGITFLLIDLASKGVSVSPIELISGESEFCITTFNDVIVPVENRVGEEGAGWSIAKRLLQHERQMYANDARSDRTGSGLSLHALAKRSLGERKGRLVDAVLRDEIARVEIDRLAYDATVARASEVSREGRDGGALSSFLKYYLSELNKRATDLRLRLLGEQGLIWSGDAAAHSDVLAAREWLRSKSDSIAGGTTEIQLNVIAKRVLGLPGN